MLKEWVLIALLISGEPVQDAVSGEDCHAIYDALGDGLTVTKEVDGKEIPLMVAACIPLDVFNQVLAEKAEKPR